MGVVFTPDSAYAKEMCKWNAHHTEFGPPGRPFTFSEYPKRLYKAARVEGQGIVIVDSTTVESELEERNLRSRGFHFGQDAAIAAIEREHTEHARLAAEREWQIQHNRISEKAVGEVRAAEAEHGARHLPDVPVTPIKKRGRKPKAEAVTHA